ncbi:hypothetical protein [Fictibacillus sp. KU28468]|nr:hypothetical protein [Fictibacillus sp. KU28468]UZJ76959.1 hypothetical protein OKX00_12105 [Fictibacillus sp. KU28468]
MNNEQNTAFCKLLKEHLERLQDPAESLQSGGSSMRCSGRLYV